MMSHVGGFQPPNFLGRAYGVVHLRPLPPGWRWVGFGGAVRDEGIGPPSAVSRARSSARG